MRQSKATIKDVARESGVSTSTVGYILSGNNTYKFKAETKKLVEQAAARLNYRPNPIASSFRKQKNNIIIGIVGNVYRYVDALHVKALEKNLRLRGYNLMVQFLMGMSDRDKLNFFKKVYSWGSGIVVIDFGITDEKCKKELAKLLKTAPPTVSLFSPFEGSMVNYTRVNWGDSFNLIADYLKKEQRFTVGCCLGFEDQRVFNNFSEAMALRGLDPVMLIPDESVGYCCYYETGQIIAKKLLESKDLPQALYCISDEITFSIIQVFDKAGIKVPEDVLIISGGDSEFYPWFNCQVPVLMHDIDALAKKAADDLIDRAERGETFCGSGKCIETIKQEMIFPEQQG
jgi:LacI family transcriptional regulator